MYIKNIRRERKERRKEDARKHRKRIDSLIIEKMTEEVKEFFDKHSYPCMPLGLLSSKETDLVSLNLSLGLKLKVV